jgi:hypothetical protein
VDVQVKMSSLIYKYMLLFSARLGKFRHADPYEKIFNKTLIYLVLMNRKTFNFLFQLAHISLRLGPFRVLTFCAKSDKSFRKSRSE